MFQATKLKKKLGILPVCIVGNCCTMNHSFDCRGTLRKSCPVVGNQGSTCLLCSPSGGCWGGDALSECPAKVGGEWLPEVYGDLWPLPQALIASSSVGSPGRPMVNSDQHRGSCRWAHQNAVYWGLLWRQMVSRSAPKPDDKQRGGREKRRDGQLVTERGSGLQLGLQRHKKQELWEPLALLVPIKYYWGEME